MWPSQTQDPLAIKGKQITHLGSIHFDQDKLRLAQEVRNFFLPQCQMKQTYQAN